MALFVVGLCKCIFYFMEMFEIMPRCAIILIKWKITQYVERGLLINEDIIFNLYIVFKPRFFLNVNSQSLKYLRDGYICNNNILSSCKKIILKFVSF